MLKLNNKKGFTLVEAICGVSIFSILLLFAAQIKINEIKLNKINHETIRYTYFLDTLKKELISNTSEEQVIELESKGKVYVPKAKIENDDSIIEINSVFLCENDMSKFPYVVLHSKMEDNHFKITLSMHTKFYGKEKIYTCKLTK